MILRFIKKAFDIREGEFGISFLMQIYIFLIIATLLIVKPTVNALFLSELGIESLPFAFLLVALTAIISSFFYSRAIHKFSLKKIIESTLLTSVLLLLGLAALLKLGNVNGAMLYFFYIWAAIYGVLAASQFWVLANLVYNVREAKRLFGFIGSGAILGGIFGGYLASLLAPLIGVENLIIIAAALLFLGIPIIRKIWKARVEKLNLFKQKKRTAAPMEKPLQLIRKSRHLSYIAGIVAISVLVAKLVDYLFSDFAAAAISDPDELTSFFAFWLSTFNLLSLAIQLFLTRRIVGIWGVGFSLTLIPLGILLGCLLFLVFPELLVVVFIKAADGTLKQSVNKSAMELLALPLPFELKKNTKSFIDVVVDSFATGVAGFILIFVVKGLELSTAYISAVIILLALIWGFLITRVRKEYFRTFRSNLAVITEKNTKSIKAVPKNTSVVKGMKSVFENGTEAQILFMLKKLAEINDTRFVDDVQRLLSHPSDKVKTAAIQNMYFLNNSSLVTEVPGLLNTQDDSLILATLEYLLLHAGNNNDMIYRNYLDHNNSGIANAALLCLAREARDNQALKETYRLKERMAKKISEIRQNPDDISLLKTTLNTAGAANLPQYNDFISEYFTHQNPEVIQTAITAAGTSIQPVFIAPLLSFLPDKKYRKTAAGALQNYGPQLLSALSSVIRERKESIAVCRNIPAVIAQFNTQDAVQYLFQLLDDTDLSIRLEVIRSLSNMKEKFPHLRFDKYKVVTMIFEECRLYHQTLTAMHTQIIISYRKRKRSGKVIDGEERDARDSLLELLERRLDGGLERIFRLLGLKYRQHDINIAYAGLLSEKQEARTQAIEFLDNLLSVELKRTLLPIMENTFLDATSEEILQKITRKIPTEAECFQLLLKAHDLNLKLAVLYLIKTQKDPAYIPLVQPLVNSDNIKLKTFAEEAFNALQANFF